MASSGSVDFSVNRNDIIAQALRDLGVMTQLDTTASTTTSPFSTYSTSAALLLNMLVKQWSDPYDMGRGIKMWSRKRAYLFLQNATAEYNLGPTTTETDDNSKWAASYYQTTLSAAEASGQSVISVTDAGSIADSDYFGVELDSGAIHWSTVNGAPSGNDVTIDTATTGAASSGNYVYSYTTTNQGRRPLSILTLLRRDLTTSPVSDIPLAPLTVQQYEALTTKGQAGDPQRYYYEPTLTDGTIYLDMQANDVRKVLRAVYLSPIEDFDAATDTPDYDQVWYLPLVLGLEYLLAPSVGQRAMMPQIKQARDEALMIAQNQNPEVSRLMYEPEKPIETYTDLQNFR